MRILPILVFIFWTQFVFGQTQKIKVQKEHQSPKVTIAGVDTGLVLLNIILANKKLMITNNHTNLKICSFDATISDDVHMFFSSGKSDILPKDLITELLKIDKTKITKFKIFNIIALNSVKDSVKLNAIDVTILK